MGNKLLALGLIFIFSGVIVTAFYNVSGEKYVHKSTYTEHNEFEVSGYFAEGDKLVLYIEPDQRETNTFNWVYFAQEDLPPNLVEEVHDLTVQVEINNTVGQRTVIDLVYVTYPDWSGGATLGLYMAYTNSSTGGLIDLGEDPEGVKGIVETNGTYTARIISPEILLKFNSTPTTMSLKRFVPQNFYPYRDMLPVGIALIGFGGFSAFWARKQRKKQRLLRKRKTKMRSRMIFALAIVNSLRIFTIGI